ncbi:PD-(D/E)XK nuclease family protein [Sulfurovum sp. CS9]|uniref:PD-(D/E)XK nuclease family protein n=1 Tax=Sulfurovum sp. CS9 TaxID=3391146 RepID=UPI0039ECC7F0
MQESLLSHIASNFIKEYENVANSSIAYLLNKYLSARTVLKSRLNTNDIPSHYETELSTKSNGRLDIVGKDANGNVSLIIEGKFWANLTDNQPVNYLKELDENGKLLFLAPDRRLSSLKIEINKRTNDERVSYLSWNELLILIEQENNKNYDANLASDLTQLKELCQKMDEEGMPPISQSDLDPMNGKIAYQFADLIDDCNRLFRNLPDYNFERLKTTSSKDGYGFYFKAFGFGCQLCFSSYDWFAKDSHTPYWLYLWDEAFEEDKKIYHFLNIFDTENSYNDYASYGILLQTGMDKNQIVNHIEQTVREVLIYLNENIQKS